MAKKKASKFAKIPAARFPKHSDGYAILNSLVGHVAVLDSDGTILFTNEPWNQFARENGVPSLRTVGPGANYLEICRRAVSDGVPGAQVILSGIQAVLEGKRNRFTIEYRCDTPTGQRWFAMNVASLAGAKGGVLTSHLDITERKRVKALLRRQQQEVKTLLDNSPDAIMRIDREIRYKYVNSTTARAAGLPPDAFLGKTPREVGLPKNLCDLWMQRLERVFDSGLPVIIEFSFPSPEGETIWEERAIPEFAADGTVQSLLVIARDITERKRLERASETHAAEFRALASRLLSVVEEERRRVSRELHDNLVQQLASLAFDIGGLVAETPSRNRVRIRLQTLQARVVKVSEEARHLAYELHPSVVDDLGLVISLRALCDEFAEEQEIIVEIKNDSLPLTIPLEVASGLYRIAQESLQNIAKHAHAKHVTVQLVSRGQELRLSIEDDGVGFDPIAVKGKGRLGSVSMEERAQMLGAKFSLKSKPDRGARIAVIVSLP